MAQTLSSPQTLKLVVKYRPVSLNRLFQWHWSKRIKERQRFQAALESSIRAALSDPKTPTIWLEQLKSALIRLEQSGCFSMTTPTQSNFPGDNAKSNILPMKD